MIPYHTLLRYGVKGAVFMIFMMIISMGLGAFGFSITNLGSIFSAGPFVAFGGMLLLAILVLITGFMVEFVDRLIKL